MLDNNIPLGGNKEERFLAGEKVNTRYLVFFNSFQTRNTSLFYQSRNQTHSLAYCTFLLKEKVPKSSSTHDNTTHACTRLD